MKRTLLPSLALLLSSLVMAGAWALENPRPSRYDGRIQFVDYKSSNVVRVNAVNGYITTITFAEGERILNYGSGYSTAWEFAAADNHFFLKPKDKQGTTNVVIVTSEHVYSLDVHLVSDKRNATYQLTFRYPDVAKAQAEAGAREREVEELLEKTDPNLTHERGVGNYQYTMNFGESEGSRYIAPVTVFDDGRFTYLKFKPQTDFPAVYSVGSDGEAMVNSHVEDGWLVIHGRYPEFRLRDGQDVVGLYNEAFETELHKETPTSSTAAGLERRIK